MDRLISLEPSSVVVIRIEPGRKCYGELSLKNVMYTMPVAFRLQPADNFRYTIRPMSGVIPPLATQTVDIVYNNTSSDSEALPETFPHSIDKFLLHSVVVPGATINHNNQLDPVPIDWFTARKKQVFIDSGIRIVFVGSPILARLVAEGNMDAIREVLEKSDPSWRAADSVDSQGRTLLHIAIGMGRADLVQLLLEFEPDVESRDSCGSSPLEAAAGMGETLIVELLLARRAGTGRSDLSPMGPVHLAARRGHLDILRLLMLKGADVNVQTEDGDTALHLAVKEKRKDCVGLLLAHGARPDVQNTSEGATPLHIASAQGDETLVRLLLSKGANKLIRNKTGKTAYDVAADHGYNRLFDVLKLGDGLCSAARRGDAKAIKKLLSHGATINGRDQHGWTALHRASFGGKIGAVAILIENGIDLEAKDEDGYTALHCGAESGFPDVVELLLKRGADAEARTNKGMTAMQIAEALDYVGIVKILIREAAMKDGVPENMDSPGKSNGTALIRFAESEEAIVMCRRTRRTSRSRRNSVDRSLPLAVL